MSALMASETCSPLRASSAPIVQFGAAQSRQGRERPTRQIGGCSAMSAEDASISVLPSHPGLGRA
jgi:hypothetical protein